MIRLHVPSLSDLAVDGINAALDCRDYLRDLHDDVRDTLDVVGPPLASSLRVTIAGYAPVLRTAVGVFRTTREARWATHATYDAGSLRRVSPYHYVIEEAGDLDHPEPNR